MACSYSWVGSGDDDDVTAAVLIWAPFDADFSEVGERCVPLLPSQRWCGHCPHLRLFYCHPRRRKVFASGVPCHGMASGRLGQESGARAGSGVKVWPECRGLRPVHVFVVPREVLRQRLVTVSLSDCGRRLLGSPNQRRFDEGTGGVIDKGNLSDLFLVKLDCVFKTKVSTR